MPPDILRFLVSALLTGLGIYNGVRMLESMLQVQNAQDNLRHHATADDFGAGLFGYIRRQQGWWGISRTYGLVFAGTVALGMPVLIEILEG